MKAIRLRLYDSKSNFVSLYKIYNISSSMPTMISNKFIFKDGQGHDIGIRFVTISIVLILLTGLLAAVLISSSSTNASATTNPSISS